MLVFILKLIYVHYSNLSGGFKNQQRLRDTYTFNVTSGIWFKAEPMLTPRSSHGCVVTAEGEVMVTGGYKVKHVRVAGRYKVALVTRGYKVAQDRVAGG